MSGAAPAPGSGADIRTFLFADMRGYTRFTQEHGDDAASALAGRFADLAKETVAVFEGELLELRGDEALCVFRSARQALRASVELQRRLRTQTAEEAAFPIGVGMGLDAGEAVPTHGGYRGAALNLAARLCALAKPGEVLASEGVVHLARRVEGLAYSARRPAALKGIDEPVRFVSVTPETPLPPVPSIATAAHNTGAMARSARAIRRHPRRAALVIGAVLVAAIIAGILSAGAGGHTPKPLPAGTFLVDLASGAAQPTRVGGMHAAGFGVFDGRHFWLIDNPVGHFGIFGSFVEIDPGTGRLQARFDAPRTAGDSNQPYAVRGDQLWAGRNDELLEYDTRSHAARVFNLDSLAGSGGAGTVYGVALGEGSQVWVSRHMPSGGGQVLAIDPAGNGSIVRRFDRVRHPDDIAYDNGVVWAADLTGVTRIDTTTGQVADVVGIDETSKDLATGAGYAWTTDPAKGVAYQIAGNGQVVHTYPTGQGANGVAFADGTAWVANTDVGTITAIDPITGPRTTRGFGHPIQALAAGGGRLMVGLSRGPTVEQRFAALKGTVARLYSQQGELGVGGDPARNTSWGAHLVDAATCAMLLNHPDAGGQAGTQLRPEIAAAMPTISADGRTYTFTIRPGYRFSPPVNQEVTAETIRQSIQRALSPKLSSFVPGAPVISDIVGEKPFQNGTALNISGLQSHGDQLSIRLTAPSPDFLQRLALPYFCPVPRGTGPAEGNEAIPVSGGEMIPSAGPYYVALWSDYQYVILRRNPNYHGPRPHAFDTIILREGVDPSVAVQRILHGGWDGIVSSGQNDNLIPVDPLLAPDGPLHASYGASRPGRPDYIAVPLPAVGFLDLRTTSGPLADPTLRRTLASAIDRTAIAHLWFQQPSDQLLPPFFPGFANRDLYPLRPASVTPPARRVRLTMAAARGCEPCTQEADLIRAELRPARIHVKIRLYAPYYPALFNAAHAGYSGIDLLDWGDGIDYADSPALLDTLVLNDEPQGWVSADIRPRIARLDRLRGDSRQAAAADLADRLARDAILIPYGYSTQGELLAPSLGCRIFPPFGYGVDLAALCPASRTP
jgi:class 3 adenylate cyclase/ABC-type transport system substrate-binding protein